MISVYGLEASQKCITPSACTAVVELVVLAVFSAGPFSFLVAFELPGSSECIAAVCPSYLMCRKVGPCLLLVLAFKAHRVCGLSGLLFKAQVHGEARHWGLLNTQKFLPDMGKAESPVRRTFFHRHHCCCYKDGILDGKEF